MDRPAINPGAGPQTLRFSDRLLSPSEQDVYANAQLMRAMANSAGHTAHVKTLWPIMFPTQEYADLYQTMYLGLRRST
jgi:hypothetical protein